MGSAFTCSNFQISIESNYVDFVKVHKSKKKKKKPRPLYRHIDFRHIIKCPSAVSANTRCHVFLYSSTFLQRNMSNCFQFQISLCYQMVSFCVIGKYFHGKSKSIVTVLRLTTGIR